ncbi:proteasome-associated protein ECM29 homolog [Lingula anatina]|uniref:Proteasome-associated protein ECM29 homolog n=1 Tax=Lingula anatina TaxID=7574 RepID=A0A2R2MT84_LINAN|nr:proteasome-associated protein ECM29 homolog [Lingula anatina]|eukprot:XP_023933323.1 proteasome-associated protein ECM29 homolog [Lingula anatina]
MIANYPLTALVDVPDIRVMSIDWNDSVIISKLYDIFRGTVVMKGKATVKPEQRRQPAATRVRMKVFPLLLKSREAADQFPACIQVIFACLFGSTTNQKLKVMAVQFVHHVCLNCSDAKFNPIGSVIMSGMVKVIDETKEDASLRGQAYLAIGKIARRLPQLVTKDIALVQKFFDAMCKEDSETKLAIQASLSMMSEAFKGMEGPNLKIMEALIMQNVEKDEHQARMMAVQYAKTVYPPDHIPSRYVLLLACGDVKEDIYAEATKALRNVASPEKRQKLDAGKEDLPLMPDFSELVLYIYEKGNQRIKSSQKYVTGNKVLPFNPSAFGEILLYLRMCLAYSAGLVPDVESTVAMQRQSPAISRVIHQLLIDKPGDNGPVQVYIKLMKQLLSAIGGPPVMYCLTEVVAGAPNKLASDFTDNMAWIKTFLYSTREDMREFAAQLYAIVVSSAVEESKIPEIFNELLQNMKTKGFECQHGSMLALGFLIGRQMYKAKGHHGDIAVEDMEVDSKANGIELYREAVEQIAKNLDSRDVAMVMGACTAIGEVGRNGSLPVADGEVKEKAEDSAVKDETVTKLSIVDCLISKVQATKEPMKVREKAAWCLGTLCVGEAMFPHTQRVMKGMLDCAQPKQIELHLTVGEALVCAALGSHSPVARDPWTVQEDNFKPLTDAGKDEVEWLLSELHTKYVRSDNPHIRQAACVWLLSLVKSCSGHKVIQENMKTIQGAFMSLLAENNEITQDIASKGLSIVYENSSKERKDELVADLVQTLMTGKRPQQQVTSDTQVFEEGALGKTPDGQSLSTYRELCSIANDLNQPDLIYKFLHLANHNAMWNSKKGAAFGFTSIFSQAGEQLAPYLPKIVPKLYRYQFDPNPKIQLAMTSIWQSLVSDNKKTVDMYVQDILEDLIKNLTSAQWRVRESSCMALHDLFRGRQIDDMVDKLPVLWENCLRVLDDIKESVRNAAAIACRTLSKASIKICDVSQGKIGEKAISLVLPCLLQHGLGSQVQDVRAVGISTIVKISKNAGALLKPHIPLLVYNLLESVSGLEPQVLNYLSLRIGANQMAQEKLDSARIAASKSSPMMETVNMCIQYVDGSVLPELVPKLTDLIRSGVGLGTKAGCANIVISLTYQCPQDLKQYAGKLMSSLLNGLHDKSATIRKVYATALGYLVKVSKDSSVEKLIQKLKTWYMDKEDESTKSSCGLTLQAITHHAPDVLKRHAAEALPMAFLAMHDKRKRENQQEEPENVWEEVWTEGTPGTEAGIRLYLKELVALCQVFLQSQSWHRKAQGALAIKTLASKLGSTLGPPQLGEVMRALLSGLTGRTWPGKETLLTAISEVCVSCRKSIENPPANGGSEQQPTIEQILDFVMKECKKENLAYKMEAVKAMGIVLETYQADRFQELADILYPHVDKDAKSGEEEEELVGEYKDLVLSFKEVAFEALGQAWPEVKATQDVHAGRLWAVLTKALSDSYWKQQVAVLHTMTKVLDRLLILQEPSLVEEHRESLTLMVQPTVDPLVDCLGNMKYSTVRTEALDVTERIVKKLHVVGHLSLLSTAHQAKLVQCLDKMAQDSKPELKDKASDIRKFFGTS